MDPEEEGAVQDPVVRAAKAAEGEEQTRVKWSRKVEQNCIPWNDQPWKTRGQNQWAPTFGMSPACFAVVLGLPAMPERLSGTLPMT